MPAAQCGGTIRLPLILRQNRHETPKCMRFLLELDAWAGFVD